MDYELGAGTFCANDANEFLDILPLVQIIDTQSALDRDWNSASCAHFCNNLGNKMGVFHQDSSERPFLHFVGRTPAIDVDFIIPVILTHLCCFGHCHGVVTSKLAHNGMLVV